MSLCFIFSYACSARFTTGQYEKHISVTTDNTDDFCSNVIVSRVEAITRYRELTPEKVMGHKGKFMMRELYIQKGTSWDNVALNSEEIKPVVLFIVKLCLAGGISWLK